MILYTLKKYVNEKLSAAYGKFFAYPVVTQTYGLDELAEHMESHNTPFSKGAIKGMLTDMVSCVRELVLQGIAVKIPDLAIFSIGIKNKEGAASEKEFSITKNITGLKLRARVLVAVSLPASMISPTKFMLMVKDWEAGFSSAPALVTVATLPLTG